MLYQLENTLKDVINDKCHKCHKCYKSNKCYKILIKYNLSFHNWMFDLTSTWVKNVGDEISDVEDEYL